MALSLDEAIARVPYWASADAIQATPLGGGITNNNFRIDVNGESFVLRITGEDTELLGINREYEYIANREAGKLGIAPEVFFFIQPEGYLVTRFINGKQILPGEMRQPENIRKVMESIKKIHNMQATPSIFNAFWVIRNYVKTARQYRVSIPKEYEFLEKRLQEAEISLSFQPNTLCPCHNDLLNANFLTTTKLYILDWEYAGMGDPFFDLANFSDHHELSEQQDHWMLENYFDGEIKTNHWAHLMIMKIISNLREAAWGFVQIGISKLDFDFQAYADKFFGRVLENIYNPLWKEHLKEVRKNV